MTDEKTFLHNKFLLQDAKPLKYFHKNLKIDKNGEEYFIAEHHRLAKIIQTAERFVLDEDALWTIIKASGNPKGSKQEAALELAKLPFEKMFLEFDLATKNKIHAELGTLQLDGPAPFDTQAGFLLQRIYPNNPDMWHVTYMSSIPNNSRVDFGNVGYWVNIEHQVPPVPASFDEFFHGKYKEQHKNLSIGTGQLFLPLENPDYWNALTWGTYTLDKNNKQVPAASQNMLNSVRLTIPLISAIIFTNIFNSYKELLQMSQEAVRQGRGDLRFLVHALALINCVESRMVLHQPKHEKRVVGTRVVRYLTHNNITLNLKRETAVQKLVKAISHEERRLRRHYVRGHWRRQFKDGVMVGRKWIEKYERGDASIGWVYHQYDVTAKEHESPKGPAA
jgi:hypothetical protein